MKPLIVSSDVRGGLRLVACIGPIPKGPKSDAISFASSPQAAAVTPPSSSPRRRDVSPEGSVLGILAADGVVLVGEKKVTSKLLQASRSAEKMYKVDSPLACAVAGIMSDANILINTARLHAQRYALSYQEPIPVEQLVQSLCGTK